MQLAAEIEAYGRVLDPMPLTTLVLEIFSAGAMAGALHVQWFLRVVQAFEPKPLVPAQTAAARSAYAGEIRFANLGRGDTRTHPPTSMRAPDACRRHDPSLTWRGAVEVR